MQEGLTKEILTRLDVVAAKIGVGAEKLWGFLLKDAFVGGVEAYVFASVLGIAAMVLGVLGYKASKVNDYDVRESHIAIYFLAVILGVASLGIYINYVENFVNPEYVAFKTLMGMLK